MASKSVFVSGNFYSLHPGHVRLLRFAAECGDTLIVGVYNNRPSTDVPSPQERADALNELGIVDRVAILENGLLSFIEDLKPAVIVKGKEFENTDNIEQQVIEKYGGALIFSAGEATYSGSDLLSKESDQKSNTRLFQPTDYLSRHNLSASLMLERVESFSNLNVLVVGDLIVDEYVTCEALGMSREDPALVVTPQHTDRFIGGAGIVASHAAMLGASVRFLSVVGKDEIAQDAAKKLSDFNVNATLIEDQSRPTTLKQRYRAQGKTMLRVSHLRQHEITKELQHSLAERAEADCKNADLVLFSDFSYGCLPQDLVNSITASAIKNGAIIAADSQSSSQIGDVSRFKKAQLLSPTEFEARLALRDQTSGLAQIATQLIATASCNSAFIKLGESGVFVVTSPSSENEQTSDRIPALNKNPRDVSGAGDSMLTVGSMALAAGASTWEAAYLGSVAAGIQTSRTGNIPISAEELLDALQ
ncbi:MAG: PfkB family carbohydrate kinase [Rhodospirillaceae bacterium]